MLNVNDIVVKNSSQFKILSFFTDFDMITDQPYRVAVLTDYNNQVVAEVAENIILSQYQINKIEDVNIDKVLIAILYDTIGDEFMEFTINNKSEIDKIITDYNTSGEYNLIFQDTKLDYEYSAA